MTKKILGLATAAAMASTLVIAGSQPTAAQFTVPSLGLLAPSLGLSVEPSSPAAGAPFKVEAKTFGADNYRSEFLWFLNGKLIREASGIGKTSYQFTAAVSGAAMVIRVLMTNESGLTAEASETVRPNAIALYWWADTKMPYWYKGKSLVTPSSAVHLMAIPTDGRTDSQSLIYKWVLDQNIQPGDSGFGRQVFSFRTSFIPKQDHFINVTAETFSQALVGKATAHILNRSPEVRLHEMRPLSGINSGRALKTFEAASGDPYDFTAELYFFSAERKSALNYRWTFNGQEIGGVFDAPWLFTLKSKAGETSVSQLSVRVSDPAKAGEQAFAALQVNLR